LLVGRAFVECDLDTPASGIWEVTVRGTIPQEFQLVAVSF
jgi:hypothetical protein